MYSDLQSIRDRPSETFADPSALGIGMLSGEASSKAICAPPIDEAAAELVAWRGYLVEYQILIAEAQTEAVIKRSFLRNLMPVSRNTFEANKVRQQRRFAEGAGMSYRDRYWRKHALTTDCLVTYLLGPKSAKSVQNWLYLAQKHRLMSYLE